MSDFMNDVLAGRRGARREENPAEPEAPHTSGTNSHGDIDAGSHGTEPLPPSEPGMNSLIGRAYRVAREQR